MCTPSLALHLIKKAPKITGEGVKAPGFKILLCGAEPGASIPEVRKRLESEYGARLFDGGAGVGVSCDWPKPDTLERSDKKTSYLLKLYEK
jgi:phenylacetate-CoA ligase